MCHCEDLNTCRKSSLNRVDFLYDNELDSDVVFLVGMEPDVWRIPGHKEILSQANPVFRALLEGPLATDEKTIVVEDVEGRAFDYMLRFLYGKAVSFQSATTALSTLYAAHKYLCTGLIQVCVKYLDENLNTKNVLEIYTHARLYAVGNGRTEFEPSAPEASHDIWDLHTPTHCYPPPCDNGAGKNDVKASRDSSIPFWSEILVQSCLIYIDENADQVLTQEGIEDMSAEDLKEIIKRDTLVIKSEYIVFLALDRWTNRECKRRKLNLNSKNRRLVLNDLIYELRFPYFSSEEFVLGPIQSGWLDQQELALFSALISKSKHGAKVPHPWESSMENICRKRKYTGRESLAISQRSHVIESDKSKGKGFKKNYSIFRKIKSKNTKSGPEKISSKNYKGNPDENDRSCSKCFPEFMVDILVCLFD